MDHAQLRDLLGDAELRELLDPDVLDALERQLQSLDEGHRARSADGIHDLLLRLGDLSRDELGARVAAADVMTAINPLVAARRIIVVPVAGEPRYVAVEDAARYRDALGAPLPLGLPDALLQPVRDAVGDLIQRYARTHGPFTAATCGQRFGLSVTVVQALLARLATAGRVLQGEFRPGGFEREWCGVDVLRTLRQRSLARLRKEIEPVEPEALGRLAMSWQGVGRKRRGLDALLDSVEQLQGAPLVGLGARARRPARAHRGVRRSRSRSPHRGRRSDVGRPRAAWRARRPPGVVPDRPSAPAVASWAPGGGNHRRRTPRARLPGRRRRVVLRAAACGHRRRVPDDLVDALWTLVWRGLVTNDSLHALRAYVEPPARSRRREAPAFRSRRVTPPPAQGRWSLLSDRLGARPSPTEWATAVARQLLSRHGVLTREAMNVEAVPGGYGAIYGVLRAMEDAGRVRRGMFVAGLGAAQFTVGPALDLLRAGREPGETPHVVALASTDPANPYGGVLPWPAPEGAGRPTRSAGTLVILVDGRLAAWIGRGDRQVLAWLPEDEPRRQQTARAIADALNRLATESPRQGLLVAEVNGLPVGDHPLAAYLDEVGFTRGAMGMARAEAKKCHCRLTIAD